MLRRFSLSNLPSKLPKISAKTIYTEEDIEEIRRKEWGLIEAASQKSCKKNNGETMYVYIISNTWLSKWKLFINNQGPRPGSINNADLLNENGQPKEGLEKVTDYRGLNENEWNIFYHAYKGGPIIIRNNIVDIYSEPVIVPNIQTRIRRRISDVSVEAKKQVLKLKEDTSARLTMEGEIKSAIESLQAIINPEKYLHQKERNIPLHILKNARGLAFMTEVKAGFLFSAKGGSGFVIARCNSNESGWSGPSCFGHAGIAAGFLAGVSQTKTTVILNKDIAVHVFKGKNQFKFGGDLEVAVGPIGRNAGGDIRYSGGFAPCYSYSHSKGLYGGISIDGTAVIARNEENARFYGKSVTPEDILNGAVEPPKNNALLSELYAILKKLDERASLVLDGGCLDEQLNQEKAFHTISPT